jgi:hypothetical protein
VPDGVGQAFLRNAIDIRGNVVRHAAEIRLDIEAHRGARSVERIPASDQLRQAGLETKFLGDRIAQLRERSAQAHHHASCDAADGPCLLGEIGPPARAGRDGTRERERRGEALTELVVQLASHLLTLVVANLDQTVGQRDSLGPRPFKPAAEIVDGAPDQGKLACAKRRQTSTIIAKRNLAQSRDNRGGRRQRVSDGQRREHKDGQRHRRRKIGDRGNAQPRLTHCGFRVGNGEDRPGVGLARAEGAIEARLRSENPLIDRFEPERRQRADSFDLAAESRRLAGTGREDDADAWRYEFQRSQCLPFRGWKQTLLAQAAAPRELSPVDNFELGGDPIGGCRRFPVDAPVRIHHRPRHGKRQAEGHHADQSDNRAQREPQYFSPFHTSRSFSARASQAYRIGDRQRQCDESRENCPRRRGTPDLAPADARALSFFTGRPGRPAKLMGGQIFA